VRQALRKLTVDQFKLDATDIFAQAGLAGQTEALQSLDEFLSARIHLPEKTRMYGSPYPGFVEYVRALHDAGVRVVYLTGRREALELTGTRELIRFFGLPLDDSATLLLKSGKVSTPEYKAREIQRLTLVEKARIVAFFDNEPENLLTAGPAAGGAMLVFVDTDFMRVPEEAAVGWYRLRHW
jgi:hypothetical protein